uniref:Uncharacterized protein n=1 Tax=Anguilla anguilla TaxID=7936 RepID=A0A0E9XJG4_ANGAN
MKEFPVDRTSCIEHSFHVNGVAYRQGLLPHCITAWINIPANRAN